MVRLNKSLVRPHIEYSTSIWNPHYEKDKGLLEKVQRRFTRLFKVLRSREYDERLKILRLWSLEKRRHRSDLLELLKMVRGLFAIPLTSFFKLADMSAGSVTRGHAWKLIKTHSNTDISDSTGCSKKRIPSFIFWDNFGNSAPILTILSLLQAEFMARKYEVLPPTALLLCDHIT